MLESLYLTPVSSFLFALTIGLSILVFSKPAWYRKLILHPYTVTRDRSKLYTLFTSGLIHKDWMHLIFNMVTFYYFGFSLEQMFVQFSGPAGHLLFALLYILALVLSDIPTLLQHRKNPHYYSLGASGAICAVLFSYILFQPKTMLGLFMIIPIPAYLFAFLFLGYCIWAAKKAQDHVNHDAHLYGALTGIVLTLLFYPWSISHFIGQF